MVCQHPWRVDAYFAQQFWPDFDADGVCTTMCDGAGSTLSAAGCLKAINCNLNMHYVLCLSLFVANLVVLRVVSTCNVGQRFPGPEPSLVNQHQFARHYLDRISGCPQARGC